MSQSAVSVWFRKTRIVSNRLCTLLMSQFLWPFGHNTGDVSRTGRHVEYASSNNKSSEDVLRY